MCHDAAGDDFKAWLEALRALTGSARSSQEWRERRYNFAHALGKALVGDRGESAVTANVVYGIWLSWGLVYVGQTRDAHRRLRDLPVGESHHLANTFPAEIWDRVLVLSWPLLPEAAAVQANLNDDEIGLALEHRLQRWLNPLANTTRRTYAGGWRTVDWASSLSRGARAADHVEALFSAVEGVWSQFERDGTARVDGACRIVRPPEILRASNYGQSLRMS